MIRDHGIEDRRREGEVRAVDGRLGACAGKRRRLHAARRPRRFARQGHRELGAGDALQAFRGVLARSSSHERNTAFDFNGDSTSAARRRGRRQRRAVANRRAHEPGRRVAQLQRRARVRCSAASAVMLVLDHGVAGRSSAASSSGASPGPALELRRSPKPWPPAICRSGSTQVGVGRRELAVSPAPSPR